MVDEWACAETHLFKCDSALGGMAIFTCTRRGCGLRAEALADLSIVAAARRGAPWEWVRKHSRKIKYRYPKEAG